MRRLVSAVALFCLLPHAGFGACEGDSAKARVHLVELYTSSGCDSCPPAEKWMTTLHKHPELAGLEFHVDYWDSAQWRDPYSNHAYTLRQQAIAKVGNRDQIYSPQIWIDGRVWQNWPKGAPPQVDEKGALPLKVAVENGDPVRVRIDTDAAAVKPDYRLYAALSESGLTEHVNGGENRGKTLDHDNVVRAFAGPLALPHAQTELKAPAKAVAAKLAVVAFVQDERDGSVVQTVRVPLAECRQ